MPGAKFNVWHDFRLPEKFHIPNKKSRFVGKVRKVVSQRLCALDFQHQTYINYLPK